MTASLRPIIADILRKTAPPRESTAWETESVFWRRWSGANLLDYVEATEQVDLFEECQDDLAQAKASVDELQTDLSDLRDAHKKLKAKNAEMKAEAEGRRARMDELGIDY